MSSADLVPGFAWLAPRLLLLFGIGFLIANIIATTEIVRYHRRKNAVLLIWPRPKPRYYWANILLGVILGLLIVAEILLRRPMYSLFGEAMMFVYYIALYPRRTRIPRGFYHDGVWSDSGFMRWSTISGVSWKEDKQHVTLILVSNTRNVARRLEVPTERYGEARRLLKDRVKAHDLNMGGVGLNLGSREGGDSI
jgi:hypothetical protein